MNASPDKTPSVCIMSATAIEQKTKRIAYTLVEQHADMSRIALVGIWENGYLFAKGIQKVLLTLSGIQVPLAIWRTQKKLSLWKQSPQLEHLSHIQGHPTLILVDDVINTGRTLWVALQTLMQATQPEQIEIAVLVARTQKRLPIAPQYVGTHLPTTLNQYVEAKLHANQSVYMYG